ERAERLAAEEQRRAAEEQAERERAQCRAAEEQRRAAEELPRSEGYAFTSSSTAPGPRGINPLPSPVWTIRKASPSTLQLTVDGFL
ncbi:MAG: hypothetical protein RMJ98_14105, partial [Myxococcales bacterium]|nr:hypothetical protein [Myxococcales bacterium]